MEQKHLRKLLSIISSNKYILAILVIALLLRLLAINSNLHVDESFVLANAKAFTGDSFELYINQQDQNYERLRTLSIPIAAVFQITSPSVVAGRLFIVLFGLFSTFMLYLIGKQFSKEAGLIAALLWASSPLAISIDTFVRGYAPFSAYILLTLYLYLNIWEQKNKWRRFFLANFSLSFLFSLAYAYIEINSTFSVIFVFYIALIADIIRRKGQKFSQYANYAFLLIPVGLSIFGTLSRIVVDHPTVNVFPVLNQAYLTEMLTSGGLVFSNGVTSIFPILLFSGFLLLARQELGSKHTSLLYIFTSLTLFYLFYFNRYVENRYLIYFALIAFLLIAVPFGKYVSHVRFKNLVRAKTHLIFLLLVIISISSIYNRASIQDYAKFDSPNYFQRVAGASSYYRLQDIKDQDYLNSNLAIYTDLPYGTIFLSDRALSSANNIYFYEPWVPTQTKQATLDFILLYYENGSIIVRNRNYEELFFPDSCNLNRLNSYGFVVVEWECSKLL